MRSNFSQHFWIGFFLGLIVPLISLIFISVVYSVQSGEAPLYFLQEAIAVKGLQANLIKLSLVFNLIPFFLFMRKNKYRHGYGVIFATLLCAFVLVINYMV